MIGKNNVSPCPFPFSHWCLQGKRSSYLGSGIYTYSPGTAGLFLTPVSWESNSWWHWLLDCLNPHKVSLSLACSHVIVGDERNYFSSSYPFRTEFKQSFVFCIAFCSFCRDPFCKPPCGRTAISCGCLLLNYGRSYTHCSC